MVKNETHADSLLKKHIPMMVKKAKEEFENTGLFVIPPDSVFSRESFKKAFDLKKGGDSI